VHYTRGWYLYFSVEPGKAVSLSKDFQRTDTLIAVFGALFMAKPKRQKTVGTAIQEVREYHERIAIHRVLASYLRTRYLPRDAQQNPAKIPCQGAHVSQAMIEEMAQELEEGSTEMEKAAKAYEQQELQT
jgi:hypothetical protein